MITWNEVEKNWTTFKPKVHNQWPKLTETELSTIAGKRTMLVKTIETDYKVTHAEAEKQIDAFLKAAPPLKT